MSKDGFEFPGVCLEVSRAPSWTYLAAFLFVSACAQQPTVQHQPTAQLQPAASQASAAYTTEELRANAKQVAIQPPSISEDDIVCRKETRVGSHFRRVDLAADSPRRGGDDSLTITSHVLHRVRVEVTREVHGKPGLVAVVGLFEQDHPAFGAQRLERQIEDRLEQGVGVGR